MEDSGRSVVAPRLLADTDPTTGQLITDDEGHPVMVMHYNAREAAALLGVSHETVRRCVRAGHWPGRLVGPRKSLYLTTSDVAVAIESMKTGPRSVWLDDNATGPQGVRGLVIERDDDTVEE